MCWTSFYLLFWSLSYFTYLFSSLFSHFRYLISLSFSVNRELAYVSIYSLSHLRYSLSWRLYSSSLWTLISDSLAYAWASSILDCSRSHIILYISSSYLSYISSSSCSSLDAFFCSSSKRDSYWLNYDYCSSSSYIAESKSCFVRFKSLAFIESKFSSGNVAIEDFAWDRLNFGVIEPASSSSLKPKCHGFGCYLGDLDPDLDLLQWLTSVL